MKFHKCKKESDEVISLLSYFINGNPIFRKHCKSCEKKIWESIRKYYAEECK